jgi:hypothetical protein
MSQPTLFADPPDKPLPHNGTPTSRLAAKVMKPLAGKQLAKIFEFLKSRGADGATDQEQQLLGLSGDSQRPRRNRLVELGWVKDSGVMRMTKSGTPAKVWIVTDTAPELLTDSQKTTGGQDA